MSNVGPPGVARRVYCGCLACATAITANNPNTHIIALLLIQFLLFASSSRPLITDVESLLFSLECLDEEVKRFSVIILLSNLKLQEGAGGPRPYILLCSGCADCNHGAVSPRKGARTFQSVPQAHILASFGRFHRNRRPWQCFGRTARRAVPKRVSSLRGVCVVVPLLFNGCAAWLRGGQWLEPLPAGPGWMG